MGVPVGVGVAVGIEVGVGVLPGVWVGVTVGVGEGGIAVGLGLGLIVEDGDGDAVGELHCGFLIASMYAPYPDGELNSAAGSMAVPSPHSLKVVMSCHCAPLAIMAQIAVFQAGRSRESRGLDSLALKKPGLIENEYCPC